MADAKAGRDRLASGVALTKFRVPRLRHDALPREALLARLRASVDAHPLTTLVAPAGHGKTTLLAQLAASFRDTPLAWISLDDDDDDPNRLYANLVRSLQPLGLEFDAEPDALIATAGAAGPQTRAAVGALVNALCTVTAPRLVLIVDDLHRVRHPDVAPLLEALVERLPEHVALVLAGRVLPPLPLARWVIHGEAAEFGAGDLRFDAAEAQALATARAGHALAPGEIERLLARTDGWAAGLALLLRASAGAGRDAPDADQQLFEYLAAEVLAGLPDALREFATDVAVLAELTPQACATVSGRGDAALLLRELTDRDLFVTTLDARRPVLRFHDLFRDFLLGRVAQDANRRRELHRRAAGVERSYARAIHHWMAAGDWPAALARLLEAADQLFAEGGHFAVERWLERFPSDFAAHASAWHHLRGVCAWRRWDWLGSRAALERALQLMPQSAAPLLRARTLLYLMGSRSGLGDFAGAAALALELRELPMDDADRAAFALLDAWSQMARGNGVHVVKQPRAATMIVATDPQRIGPATADRAHSIYVGLPGALAAYRDLLQAYSRARGAGVAPWQGTSDIIDGWVGLWEADRARTEAAIARAHEILRRFGAIPPLQDGLARLEAVFLAVSGRGTAALAIASQLVTRFAASGVESLRLAFEGAYVHTVARVAWASAQHEAFRAIAPRAARPPRPEEWAFVGVAARTVDAQLALLDGDLSRAATGFEARLTEHATLRCPMGQPDPRIGLAYARLRQGRQQAAIETFERVLDECIAERSLGILLLEPDWLVAPLVAALPAVRRTDPVLAPLLASLATWRQWAAAEARAAATDAAPLPGIGVPAAGPLAMLSSREREVLARVADGASNKEIARELDLSLHTVKRHIANLLGKLDCVSRRQAAELLRRSQATSFGSP